VDQPTDAAAAIEAMRALLAEHDLQERRVAEAYAAGYRDGHASGWEVGYRHAHEEMTQAWSAVVARVRAIQRRPTTAERQAMDEAAARGEPCSARCGRCSRCARADAVARHGGDYLGRHVPGRPLRRSA
jgi:hypothetical protein